MISEHNFHPQKGLAILSLFVDLSILLSNLLLSLFKCYINRTRLNGCGAKPRQLWRMEIKKDFKIMVFIVVKAQLKKCGTSLHILPTT